MSLTNNSRKQFLITGTTGLIAAVSGAHILSGCHSEPGEEKEVSPPEDLMQEHGVLNRILLVYDKCRQSLMEHQSFNIESLARAAEIVRNFVEDYHEKHEEEHLFPRFEKANKLTDLTQVLRKQHDAGRNITAQIFQLSKQTARSDAEAAKLVQLLGSFNIMYRPHEAREDTVLFPAFRKLVSKHEYCALGEDFEKDKRKLFGEDGFETMVDRVATIEKELGIYQLDSFTPKE